MKQTYHSKGEIAILRKNGQLVIPKRIRDAKKLKAGDQLMMKYIPDCTLIIRKKPEDKLIEIVRKIHHFNWREAWKEVKEERKRKRS